MSEIRRIYYDLFSGTVIQDTGERFGGVNQTSIEQEIAIYRALSERNRDTFDVIELPFGAFAQDFNESKGNFRVDVETKKLEFSYPDPNAPEIEQPFQPPMSEEIKAIKKENKLLQAQSTANSDRADFQEEVITEIIMMLMP